MPKPVLSDSLFNADDVATAILSEANLQISSSDLGVVDRASKFVVDSYWSTINYKNVYSFNGFMFFSFTAFKANATPSNGQIIFTIDSNFVPNAPYVTPTIGYQADSAEHVIFQTNGNVEVHNPNNPSSHYYVVVNGWYRFAT